MKNRDWSKVKKALYKLQEQDYLLLSANASERSICHKLATYLQEQFADYNVDCEYNLNIENENHHKMIHLLTNEYAAIRSKVSKRRATLLTGVKCLDICVFPDIIIHHRNKTKSNNIIIEIKKSNNMFEARYDELKIIKYTDEHSELHYTTGLFMVLPVKEDIDKPIKVDEYKNGIKIHSYEVPIQTRTRIQRTNRA